MKHYAIFLAVAVAAVWSSPALADPCEAPLPKSGARFSGPVRYVGDGDMICVSTRGGLVEVRLADFYAPELAEPDGRSARDRLAALAMGRTARCLAGRRSYDRVVAQCSIDGLGPIGAALRAAGGREGGRSGPVATRKRATTLKRQAAASARSSTARTRAGSSATKAR